jgi:hypothetical protein
MLRALRIALVAAAAAVSVPLLTLDAQQIATRSWTQRTADGQPDLQGVWSNDVITPLQRPTQLKDKTILSPQEVAALKARAAELFTGDGDAGFSDDLFVAVLNNAKQFKSADSGTGNYNHFWVAERTFDNRTSLITDPPDGRLPALTAAAARRQADAVQRRKSHPADGPEDRGLTERCITFGLPNVLAGYNANIQILQSRDYVAISQEMIHDVRLIPLDGRPHIDANIRHRLGDSRGRWDGNTLVVETTNFVGNAFQGSSEDLRLVERFTRVDADTLHYEFRLEDPQTWTGPWTAMIPYQKAAGKVYEYACHEGNHGMTGILSGHRAQEKDGRSSSQP